MKINQIIEDKYDELPDEDQFAGETAHCEEIQMNSPIGLFVFTVVMDGHGILINYTRDGQPGSFASFMKSMRDDQWEIFINYLLTDFLRESGMLALMHEIDRRVRYNLHHNNLLIQTADNVAQNMILARRTNKQQIDSIAQATLESILTEIFIKRISMV